MEKHTLLFTPSLTREEQSEPGTLPRRDAGISPRWLLGLALAFWTLFMTQSVGWRYYWTQFSVNPRPLNFIIRAELLMFGIYALLTPPIFLSARRFPLARKGWRISIGAHLVFGVLFAAIAKFLWDLAMVPMYRNPWIIDFSWSVLLQSLLSGVQISILLYWVIVVGLTAIHHVVQYRSKATEAAELRALLAEAQLQTLRIQLDPHFLFNTLHSISGLVHTDPDGAEEMIANLSELLRRSLAARGRNEILLSEEIDFLRLYLDIQRRRFADRLSVRYEIEAAAARALVPGMILQPLVENSIRHAIAPRRSGGTLLIRAGVEQQKLLLEVEDFGGKPPAPPVIEGVGLRTTRQRLEQMYAGLHQFELLPRGDGLCVRVSLPYHAAAV
jgi:two-component sensor histidine kinase